MKAAIFIFAFIAVLCFAMYGSLLVWFAPYMTHVHLLSNVNS